MEPLFARLIVLTFLGIAAGICVNAILLQDVRVAHFKSQGKGQNVVVHIDKPFLRRPLKDDKPYVASLRKDSLEAKIRDVLKDEEADLKLINPSVKIVKDIQDRLAVLGYYPGKTDGVAGPTTRAAIMAYELDKGFQQTGVPDIALLKVLRGEAKHPERLMKQDDLTRNSQELVTALQRALTKLGYDTGKPDGIIGPLTRKKIRAFERDHKLDITGRISGRLVEAIHKAQGQPIVLASLSRPR